jgi:hypothetical protein
MGGGLVHRGFIAGLARGGEGMYAYGAFSFIKEAKMRKRPKLFNVTNTYRLIRDMVKAIDLQSPAQVMGPNSTLTLTDLEHVDVCIIREAGQKNAEKSAQVPYLVIRTKPSNVKRGPQALLTIRFDQTDIRQTIHEHTVVGTMEQPTDWSMLNALKLALDMQKAAEKHIFEEFGVTGFHELFGPIQKRHSGECRRIDKRRHTVRRLLADAS